MKKRRKTREERLAELAGLTGFQKWISMVKRLLILTAGSLALNEWLAGKFLWGLGGIAVCLFVAYFIKSYEAPFEYYAQEPVISDPEDPDMPRLYRLFMKFSIKANKRKDGHTIWLVIYTERMILYGIIISTIASSVHWFSGFLIRGAICVGIEGLIQIIAATNSDLHDSLKYAAKTRWVDETDREAHASKDDSPAKKQSTKRRTKARPKPKQY